MLRTVTSDIPRAILLILIQILVLNQLDLFNGSVQPFLYIFILLLLPFETPAWAQLLIGLVLGLTMDMFTFTLGMHTSACLVLCYARPGILRILSPRDGYEMGMAPTIGHMGILWYLSYAGSLVLIHHFWLFTIEVLRWDLLPSVFLRTLLSSIATLILIFLVQFLFFRTSKK